ncbi:MAG: response regulator [Bacteroidota bacterium]
MNDLKIFFLVDDDVDDLEFFQEALSQVDPSLICITSSNGEKALEKLRGWVAPFPDLIFLDLNLPRVDGKKCLVEIKKMETFINTPVIIYSTSSDQKIINEVLALGAAHFLVKPNKSGELHAAIKNILAIEKSREIAVS